MKLFLMRHASAQPGQSENDIERSLTTEGRNEAVVAANYLKEYKIDKILVSSAKRTQQTSQIVQDVIKCPNYEVLTELYGSNLRTIIKIISDQDSKYKNLLVIAHNPGIFRTSLAFLEDDNVKYDALLESGMTPAKIVTIDFPSISSWDEIVTYNTVIPD